MATRNGNANQLNRSVNNITTRSGVPNAIPLSTSYLQTPAGSGYAPPLPARRVLPTSYGSRMGMGMGMSSYYSPYSRYPTSMYSPGFGGYRGYGAYGGMPGGESTSSFIQMAEESTRPAFESIESVVEVVSSISMMLESTYHAVHSSYSAILGVVDQFSRLKDHLAQILSIMALLRGLRWLCLKVLYLLKLRKDNPSDEAAWGAAAEAATGGLPHLPPLPEKDRGSAWPFLMFVGLVIGAPWLMFKLLSKTVKKNPLDTRVFRDDHGNLIMATAAYEFKATQRDELSFAAGEKLYISPKSNRTSPNGWLFACNQKQETGLIPSTYLQHRVKPGTQNNQGKQVVQIAGKRVSCPEPNSQVPNTVHDNQASGANSVNQLPGWQPVNQVPDSVSGEKPVGQLPGWQPVNQVPDPVSDGKPVNQLPGWQLENQVQNEVASDNPVNQVPVTVLQPQVPGSQQPWESYEDIINGAQNFNEAFGQPNNLGGNPNCPPKDSDLPKKPENVDKVFGDASALNNLNNSSEKVTDDNST